jgi:hypothetical protein
MSELDQLDLNLAFRIWAEAERFDLEKCPATGLYVDPATRGAWRGYVGGYNEVRPRPRGQQLYAEIKKSSKYASQAELCRANGYGYPFKVRIVHDGGGDYVVKGGVGGQYRLADVNLYVIEGDKKIRVC